MNKTFFRILTLIAIFICSPLQAQTAYVNDRLYLGVYAEPSSEQSAIHTLSSGSVVEILEKQETFTKVKTDNGIEGWVRSRFISEEKPASVRVKEVEDERDQLAAQLKNAPSASELNTLKSQLRTARSTIASLTSKAADTNTNDQANTEQINHLKSELEASKQKSDALENELKQLKETTPEETSDVASTPVQNEAPIFVIPWYGYLIIIISLFGGGFLFGSILLAKRVKQRFNGMKVW